MNTDGIIFIKQYTSEIYWFGYQSSAILRCYIKLKHFFCVIISYTINNFIPNKATPRADSIFAPSQWETALLCNNVSHWLGASLQSALHTNLPNLMPVNNRNVDICSCAHHAIWLRPPFHFLMDCPKGQYYSKLYFLCHQKAFKPECLESFPSWKWDH